MGHHRDSRHRAQGYEDLICDGVPVSAGKDGFLSVKAPVSPYVEPVVSGTKDLEISPTMLLIASSVTPYGSSIEFNVSMPHANNSWRLCDLANHVRSTRATAAGLATWANSVEEGTLLLFAADTPCHWIAE